MDEPDHPATWWLRDYHLTTDRAVLDIDLIHRYLHDHSYWARGVPRSVVERAVAHSLTFGLFRGDDQVGFARVVTDRAVFAYLADVFILPEHQGRGLGSWMLDVIVAHPWLQGLRRFSLATRDAHEFYERAGFRVHPEPQNVLEIRRSVDDLYGPPPLTDP